MTHLIRENHRVLVIANDPERRRALANELSRHGLRVHEARNPLEGLWHAPDVEAIAVDRGGDVELVPID